MLGFYRRHWFDIGGVLAVVVGVVLLLKWKTLPYIQLLMALNFFTLLLHQFEEYRWPGGLPGQMNGGLHKSDMPDRYPANPHSLMLLNTVGAYPFYLLPVFFPDVIWLGLGPVLLAFAQVPTHGLMMPIKLKTLYGKGFITAFFMWLPIGILYIRHIVAEGLVRPADWVYGAIYMFLFGAFVVQGTIRIFRDKHTPHRFARKQLGRWGNAS
ncbi:MAG: HXXEE domain-containing protein [Desulfatitalea sp.]|nr:HXXEE domain-containing protein [Desulfatitalea sp.]NNK00739.1 HXXEE domain-containing protein [Desulfatitalea sp.]